MVPWGQERSDSGEDSGELELHYEDLGDIDAPPILLIMGLGAQLTLWHNEFCQKLVD
ncbi:MAG: alpha/beta hydrolase, partial [Mycobacterium sp.]|nr:alpha/beta hydrolase [Mycobacterium sp.]